MVDLWGAHFTAEQINSPDFGAHFRCPCTPVPVAVGIRSNELARNRDAYARRLLEDRMPRSLHFLIDRPRALKALLRVVPRWRMRMTVVDLRAQKRWDGVDPMAPMTVEAAHELAHHWGMAMRATRGVTVPDGGVIFTYTDLSGLPAEVHGV